MGLTSDSRRLIIGRQVALGNPKYFGLSENTGRNASVCEPGRLAYSRLIGLLDSRLIGKTGHDRRTGRGQPLNGLAAVCSVCKVA